MAIGQWIRAELADFPKKNTIALLDGVRAFACLIVIWYHIYQTPLALHIWDPQSFAHPLVNAFLYFGKYGVTLFFVLSGFLLFTPFAKALLFEHTWPSARHYYVRRVFRVLPAYYLSLILIILLFQQQYLLPQHWKELGLFFTFFMDSSDATFKQLNAPFWTLAVEVQYYLLIGLAFPLLLNRHVFWGLIAPLCVVLTFLLPFDGYIFRYLPFFLLGIAAFQYRVRVLERWHFLLSVGALAMVAWISIGWQPTLAALFSALAIGFVRSAPRPFVAAGSISYSLYLIHGPIGYTVGSAMQRRLPGLPPIGIVLLSLAACILSAWVLYRLVELPSLRLSKRIRYRPRPDGVTALSEGRQGCSP
jgi:peptidoglycan/LPS O-acetylase OafA/YrhL